MSPARTAENLDALSRELSEVTWFGRPGASPARLEAPRFATIDLALVAVGAILGAILYLLART